MPDLKGVFRWVVSVALGAMLAAGVVACVDDSEPWWSKDDNKLALDIITNLPDVTLVDGGDPGQQSGLTARVPGQNCVECEGTTCADWRNPPADSLRLHFIDVGQGDSIWIQTPDNKNILIDAGDGGFFNRSRGGDFVNAYLDSHGFELGSTFDAIFISHAHSDHYGGLGIVLGSYRTLRYVDPGLEATQVSYQDTLATATQQLPEDDVYRPALLLTGNDNDEIRTLVKAKGDPLPPEIFGAQTSAWLLSSEASKRLGGDDGSKINNTSIVLKLSYAGRRAILTGDAEVEIEGELVQRFGANTEEPNLSAEILKVGHHGSHTASSTLFLSSVWAAIPAGERFAVIQSGRLTFGTTTLPNETVVRQIQAFIGTEFLFSTEAGDVNKSEKESPGDDNVLSVIRKDGTFFTCYSGE